MRPVIVLCLALICPAARACTSFVSYSGGTPLYGMNFDWHPEQDILFRMETDSEGLRVFTMSFLVDGNPVPTVGFAEDGRFSAMQVTDAPWSGPDAGSGAPFIYIPFYMLVYDSASLDALRELAGTTAFRQYDNPPLHILAADAEGSVLIIEVGEDGNLILDRSGEPFSVMTNFSNCLWAGSDPMDVRGTGADRYRSAIEALEEAGEGLNPETGMGVLRAAVNTSPGFPTRASMVFDPREQRVLLAVAGVFHELWLVDLHSGRISPWPAESTDAGFTMDSTGVTASFLLKP